MADSTRSERLASAYKRLASSSDQLKAASNEFTRPIAELDLALQKLNIDLVTWQRMAGGEDNYGGYWSRDVGYTTIDGKWCLAIRELNGHHGADEDHTTEWRFADAPSALRIQALDMLPDLLEQLTKNADKTAKKFKEKTPEAQELAVALKQATDEVKQEKDAARQQKKERR